MKVAGWIVLMAGLLAACTSAPGAAGEATTVTSLATPSTTTVPTTTATVPAPTTTTTAPVTTTTAPVGGVRIAVAGDTGTGGAAQWDVANLMAAGERDGGEFDALVLLGDLIYPEGDPGLLDTVLFGPYADVLDGGTELLPALGNHDIMMGRQNEILDGLGRTSPWYAEQVGSVLVVVLDSNVPDDPDQLAWLESELAASRDRWIIAAMHHPPYSAGSHGSSRDVRAAFSPLFEEYGVDLVLAGHDHDYQRSVPIEGVTYVVSGGGAKLRSTGSADFTVTSASQYHYVELDVGDDAIVGTAVALDGVIDRFTIPYDPADRG